MVGTHERNLKKTISVFNNTLQKYFQYLQIWKSKEKRERKQGVRMREETKYQIFLEKKKNQKLEVYFIVGLGLLQGIHRGYLGHARNKF